MTESDIYFETTKELKLKRIRDLGCDYFVDDLKEIVTEIKKPTKAILYTRRKEKDFKTMNSWKELTELIK